MNDNHQHADTNMNEGDGECRECRRYARDLAARRTRITELESKLDKLIEAARSMGHASYCTCAVCYTIKGDEE